MLNHPFLSESRLPVPLWLLEAVVFCTGIVPMALVIKTATPSPETSIVATAVVAALLVFIGWRIGPAHPRRQTSTLWMPLVGGAALIAIAGVVMSSQGVAGAFPWLLLLPALMIWHVKTPPSSRLLRHIQVPLMFAASAMFVAAALGHPETGAFPAAIAALFVAVVRATLDIEEDLFENHGGSNAVEVHQHYRKRLAMTAVTFFLFGTVSLWPWLGELYGRAYFWVMLLGVLMPLAFFWGRIRQPKMEGARTALIRFNRIAPMLGVIHAVALLIS